MFNNERNGKLMQYSCEENISFNINYLIIGYLNFLTRLLYKLAS